MGQSGTTLVYLNILEQSQDPVALRLGIICSDQFPEELKDRARSTASLEVLRSLLEERRRLVEA
ncbi:MAG: hypothetical protein ACOY94_02215 [Bacillota bacterium]